MLNLLSECLLKRLLKTLAVCHPDLLYKLGRRSLPSFHIEASEDVGDSCSQHVTVLHTCLKCVGLCLYGGATNPSNKVARPQDGMNATFVSIPQGAISKERHPSSLAPGSFHKCHFIYVNLFGLIRVRSVRDHQAHQSSWGLLVQQTRLEHKLSVVSANSVLNRFAGILDVRNGFPPFHV